ncbi:MAG: Holliday junction branch migration protein RuvA, partial [Erysipelotrichaceae bacterium]|nr:Holliday junction branch migration protein RuvA [Erysipelotrichaceae bacterium]
DAIITAVENGDVDFIRRMPGIGNKTASQIILDLKGKLVESGNEIPNEDLGDVEQALKALGYKNTEIRPVLKKLAKEKGSSDELVRKALAMLMK